MALVRRLYIDGEYGQIHIRIAAPEREEPELAPIYCLHQSPKHGGEFDAFMQTASSEPYKRLCVAIDYPGYGMSDAPARESDATIPMYAHTAWKVADLLGHDRLDLFGNHTGGKVVAEMAVQQPARVKHIVMISAAILTDDEREMFKDFFTPIPLDDAGTRFTTMWERIVNVRGPGQTLDHLSKSFLMNLMGGEEYEWGHVAAFAHGKPFEHALKALPHRITILNPTDDLTDATRRAAPLMQNGEIVELPDWGYGFLDAFTDEATELVLSKL